MNPFIRYEILSHLECRLTLRRLMAVNRAFHSLLQPLNSPALEIWARSWLEVNERSAADCHGWPTLIAC